MPEGQTVGETTTTTSSFSILTSMMPRQVMLSASSNSMSNGSKAIPSLTAEQRKLLLQTVCQFLELNGFSKTLKKFLSEAQIEKDSSKNSLYNLEDMCSQYLAMRASYDGDDKNTKKLDKQNDDITGVDNGTESIASKDKDKKEKKKQSKTHSEGNDVEPYQQSEIVKNCDKELQKGANLKSKKKKKSSNDSLPIVEDTPFEDVTRDEKSLKKLKEKKKSKSGPDSSVEDLKQKQEEGLQRVKEETKISSDAEKKSKSKSEKKMKVSSSNEIVEDKSGKNKHGDDTNESGDHEDGMEKEKKNSKKRKRVSEENEVEELKQSETDGSTEMKASDSKREDNMVESQTPAAGKHSNGFLEHNGGDKSMGQKSSKKQKTAGSTEPKSVNAFKRVDPDKVVIDDERLQDNSYWAKDGADSGYGAKAQEILGQVRGRDFRHEKTKKKRGSYRGGQIDLDSHSIKFNYSEEDE